MRSLKKLIYLRSIDERSGICNIYWGDGSYGLRLKFWPIYSYFFTEPKTYYLSYSVYKHDAIDIADPSSMQDECHMTFVIDLIGGVRVDSSWGLRIFLCPTLVIRRKTSFSISFDCFHQFFLLFIVNFIYD